MSKLGEQNKNISSGKFDFPEKNKPIIKVIQFIQKGLDKFVKEGNYKDIKNENGLTEELCDLLMDSLVKEPFWFHTETMEDKKSGQSPRIDLSAKTKKDVLVINSITLRRRKPFFKLEAKRLPTGSGRKKEYVIGEQINKKKNERKKNGGIERFKIGVHAKDLPIGGLIAFIQKYDFNHWNAEVNSWIEEQFDKTNFWNKSDKLNLISPFYKKAKSGFYKSKNKRIGKNIISDEIELYHFWVDLK